MGRQRRRLRATALLVASIAAGCSGADDASIGDTSPAGSTTSPATDGEAASTTTDATPRTAADDERMCTALDAVDPPPDLIDLVPAEHVETVQLLLDVTEPLGSETGIPADLVIRLADSGDALTAFGNTVERACGTTDVVDSLRLFAAAGAIAASPSKADYCGPLADVVSLEVEESERAVALATAIDVAPPEHLAALDVVRALADDTVGTADGPDPSEAQRAIAGLGLYAEARCGVADAFASMLIIGAFLSEGFGLPDQGTGVGVVPEPADASAANAAVPPGVDLAFEVVEIDLGDDGEYFVSAVVPVGWEVDAGLFGTTYESTGGFGIFTEISFDSGCDGMCEVTDWEARLTGSDGAVTRFRADDDLTTDRPTEGTAGVVLTKRGLSDGIEGIVVRWADGIDRYFSCEFELDEDDIALAEAFTAACEASRPGWVEAAG